MSLRPWLAALALAFAMPGATHASQDAESLRVEVQPAWEGFGRADAWTELSIRVVSERGGPIEIEVWGGATRVAASGRVEASVPAIFRVLARSAFDAPIEVTVRGPGAMERHIQVRLRRSAPSRWLVARVVRDAPNTRARPLEGVLLLDVDPVDLPIAAQAYGSLDALVVDAWALAALSDEQLRALEGNLGACGRVLVIGASAAALARGRSVAGCDGAFFGSANTDAASAELLPRLLGRQVPRLPAADPLAKERWEPSSAAVHPAKRPLVGFFGLYVAVLLLGITAIKRPWLFAALPLTASALLIASFRFASPEITLTSWTEVVSGATMARFNALVRVDGMAPGEIVVDSPLSLGLPAPLSPQQPQRAPLLHVAVVGSAAAGSTNLKTAVRTGLLSRQAFRLEGALNWKAPLVFEIDSTGPRVENPGPGRTNPGYLFWEGAVFALPALEAQVSWTPGGVPPLTKATVPRWITERQGEATVLVSAVPEPLARIGSDSATTGSVSVTASGWTLIRPKVRR